MEGMETEEDQLLREDVEEQGALDFDFLGNLERAWEKLCKNFIESAVITHHSTCVERKP